MLLEEALIGSVCLFISLFSLLASYLFWRGLRLNLNKFVIDLIFFFIIVKIVMHYAIPSVLRVASGFQFEDAVNVEPINLIVVYVVEAVSLFIWWSSLWFFSYFAPTFPKYKNTFELLSTKRALTKVAFIVISFGFIYSRLVSIFELPAPIFYEVFKSLFFYGGLAVGPFLLVMGRKIQGKSFVALGCLVTVFALISLPTRGALIYTFLYIGFLAFFVLRSFALNFALGFGFIFLCLIFFFGSGLPRASVYLDESGDISVEQGINTKKLEGRSVLEEVEWRFGASTKMSTAFYQMYNRGDSAGINPIKHSFMGFLPRSLNPDKPIPSTLVADDEYTQGMYLISREVNGYDTYSMVEFSTGGHFYWEFGALGVIILSFLSAFYIFATSFFYSCFGALSLPMVLTLFKPWGYVDPKIWISDAVLQIYQVFLPFVLLVFLIQFGFYLKRIFVRKMLDA